MAATKTFQGTTDFTDYTDYVGAPWRVVQKTETKYLTTKKHGERQNH